MTLFNKFFTNKSDQNAGAVSRHQSVIRIFQQLFKDRAPVTIKFEGYPEQQFITMILDVDKKNDCFVLDELVPQQGNQLMQQKLKFFATTSDHGVTVKFKGRMGLMDVDKNATYYRVKIPRKIDYQQRRDAFRVPVPYRTNTTVSFFSQENPLTAIVQDMSITGIRLKFEEDLTESLIENKVINKMKLHIPEAKTTLVINLELKHVFYDKEQNNTIVGAKFVELESKDFVVINQYLGALQREMRRKESSDNDLD